jgi:integrase
MPHLGARLMADITGEVVASLRGTLLRKVGPAQTRRALALLVVLLGGRMPRDANGRTVQKPSIDPRRRFMDSAELGALLRGLEAEPHLWRVFWVCCLLAPLRRGNLARARWSDLNLDYPARWTVAADVAKGRKLLAMPIAEPLAKILRDWKAQNPGAEWVFPRGMTAGRVSGEDGPIVSVQHAWARALLLAEAVRLCDAIAPHEGTDGRSRFLAFLADLDRLRGEALRLAWDRKGRAGAGSPLARGVALLQGAAKGHGIDTQPLAMRDLTPHDLRRTAASWAVQSGASLAVVAASLGHADTRVTEAHYGHLSDDPVRRMLADNAGRLLATATVPATSKNSL